MPKDIFIKVRVTEQERQRYRQALASDDQELSSFIRNALEKETKRIWRKENKIRIPFIETLTVGPSAGLVLLGGMLDAHQRGLIKPNNS